MTKIAITTLALGMSMSQLDYKVIGSGSSGNSVRIRNVLIDCGMPYQDTKPELYKCDYLLITHRHSDHLKPSTLKSIRKNFPRIKVYANFDVKYEYKELIDEITHIGEIKLPKVGLIEIYKGCHDVPVDYYGIRFKDGINVFYATDTNKVDSDLKFDYIFCEANYDVTKLWQIAKQYRTAGYDPVANAHRHLSTDDCKLFYYLHRKDKDTPLIELHKSSRFY